MKFTLSWLRSHLDTEASLATITDTLSAIGLEVESVEDRAAPLAAFRTARIVEAMAHPNADRLRACRVDVGASEMVSVVCGAPNARTGLHVVFAPPGSVIPATGAVLKAGEIRGVVSAGMLLSLREMGLGEDHDGIVELPVDAPVGLPYAAYAGLADPVIEIGVTPNRGDVLSIRGVARDLAAAGLGTLRAWNPAPVAGSFDSPVRWSIEMTSACPWVIGRTVRGLRNGPSPDWLQRRLMSVGQKPISALVDITNFFTLDLGRPLHVFDAGRVAGGTLSVRAGAGETFRALNGRDVTVGPEDCVIADAAGVQSLAGIIGGEATGATEATTSVFVECALFDPVSVALTGRRLQINSDARARFERGIDAALLPAALDAATALIIELCGGEASTVVGAGAEPAWRRQASLRFERIAGLGGSDVSPDEAAGILERLGFAVLSRDEARVVVAVPSWRNDVAPALPLDQHATLDAARADSALEGAALIEPECDLLEEVLRIAGLDRIAPVSLPPLAAVPEATLSARQGRTALARRGLAARGFAECVTFSFLDQATAARFGEAGAATRLLNPIAADLDQLRPTPLATLAQAAARNAARGLVDGALFEVGPGWSDAGQVLIAAALRTGRTPRHWSAPASPLDPLDAKADALALLASLGVPLAALSVTPDAAAHYHPGRSGQVRQGPKSVLARFGALHPTILAALDLGDSAIAIELFLDAVADPKRRRRAAPDLPALQPLKRDFAFLVDAAMSAETILRAARGAERDVIAGVVLFDVYEGDQVETGQKSLGLEVTLQPRDHTLSEAEIEALSGKVIAAVSKAGGTLR